MVFDYGCPKRENMTCQRSMPPPKKTLKEREKEKKGVAISEKREERKKCQGMTKERERTNILRSKPYHYPPIHPSTHLHILIEII